MKMLKRKAVEEEIKEEAESLDLVEEEAPKDPFEYFYEEESKESQRSSMIASGTAVVGNISCNEELCVLGSVQGDILCQAKVEIKGQVHGNIKAKEILIEEAEIIGDLYAEEEIRISCNSYIQGSVKAKEALIDGKICGQITAEVLHIQKNAQIEGDMEAITFSALAGAVLNGKLTTQKPKEEAVAEEEEAE